MTDDASRKLILAYFRDPGTSGFTNWRANWRPMLGGWKLPQGERQRHVSSFCQIIVGQQLSNAAARSIWQRLEPLLAGRSGRQAPGASAGGRSQPARRAYMPASVWPVWISVKLEDF